MTQFYGTPPVFERVMSVIRLFGRGFKSGPALSTAALAGLSALIWYCGPAISYMNYSPFKSVNNRIAAVGVLVILWGINNYFLAKAKKKEAKKDKNEQTSKEDIDRLIEILSSSFRSAVKIIREKWMGSEKGGRALYAMPWYLVIGAAESGKTALITRSDLNFPLMQDIQSLVPESDDGEMKDLPQYWVTRESVLFDIPGTWMDMKAPLIIPEMDDAGENVQEEDTSESKKKPSVVESRKRLWSAFMALLNEARPRRPINGVIITCDLVGLVRMSNKMRASAAAALHARLVDIAEQLGTRFTVHIVMTKLDRLAGFREYFLSTSKIDRQKPFGFSLPVYGELDTDEWVKSFEKEFATFIAKANNDVLDRLNNQNGREERRNTYIFLREFTACGAIISDFFCKALLSDKFSTPPLIRGVYYTSVLQEGVPFNALLTKISCDCNLPLPFMPAYSGRSAAYFSGRLFADVIFKESGLASDNRRVEKRKIFILRSSIVASVLILLGFGFILHEGMEENTERADKVLQASRDFIHLPHNMNLGGDETQFIPALNAIASANGVYPRWANAGKWRRYAALYQGRRVGPEVSRAYDDLLEKRFLPVIANEVKDEIIRLGKKPETAESDERLDALRVYLLLGDIKRRKELDSSYNTASLGKAAVMAWMQNNWQERFEGKKTLQHDLARHLDYALSTDKISISLDKSVISDAQIELRKVPRDVRLYRNLKALAARQVPSGLSLRNAIGPSYDIVFRQKDDVTGTREATDIVVPYFYTKRGFLDFFVPKSKDLGTIAVEDAWVTGERERVHYSQEDLQRFMDKIRKSYTSDYVKFWSDSLKTLNIADFRNIDDAVRVLAEINSSSNPLGSLIQTIKNETEIYPPEPVSTDNKQPKTEISFDQNREYGLRIARAFTELTALLQAKQTAAERQQTVSQPIPLEEKMAVLGTMETYMRGIKNGQQSSRPVALEKAQERAKLQGNDPIFVLRRIGNDLPSPLDKFYSQIADNCWKTVLVAAKEDLQSVWQSDVYRVFNVDLAGRYPFNRASNEEVSLQDFQRFFGGQGIFDKFFSDKLKPFVNVNTGELAVIDGQSLSVSKDFIAQISKARAIRDTLFNADGVPTLRYTVEPVTMSGSISRAILNIEGQLVPYSHGPSNPISILWPNALSGKQDVSQLSISQGKGTNTLTFSGLWSSFRLFDRAETVNVLPDSAEMVFTLNGGQVKYRIRMSATDKNPFVLRPLTSLRLPERM